MLISNYLKGNINDFCNDCGIDVYYREDISICGGMLRLKHRNWPDDLFIFLSPEDLKSYDADYTLYYIRKRIDDYFREHADNKVKKTLNDTYGLTRRFNIKKVVFNAPATVVYWADGSKTVVKQQKGDIFDPEKGLAMAVAKRALGTNASQSNYYDIFRKHTDQFWKEVAEYTKKKFGKGKNK